MVQETNIPGYYAIQLILLHGSTHVASPEGVCCVEKIAGHHPEPLDYSNIGMYVLFT
jgi:dihydrolipoamide dehydrogenase